MIEIEIDHVGDYARVRLAAGDTNALTTTRVKALSSAIAEAQKSARGVLLCGGEKFFSNGADLSWALEQSSDEMREMFLALGQCVVDIMELPIPVVGAIKGHTIGGGLAILLACDYRYGATGRVLVGKPEILLGVPNPYFGDQLLRFIAGDFVASNLIYTGKLVRAEEAVTLSLIHAVTEKSKVEEMALEQLEFLGQLAPQAFAESKQMRTGNLCADLRQQMSSRVARQVEIWNSTDAQTRLAEAADRLSRK